MTLQRRHWMAGCGAALGLAPLLRAETLPQAPVTGSLPMRPLVLLLPEGDASAQAFVVAARRSSLGHGRALPQVRWLTSSRLRQPRALQAALQQHRGQRLVAWVDAGQKPLWDHVLHQSHAARWLRGTHATTADGQVLHNLDTVAASAGYGVSLAASLGAFHVVREQVLGGECLLHATAPSHTEHSWPGQLGRWLTNFALGEDSSVDAPDSHGLDMDVSSPIRVERSWMSFVADI